MLHLPALLSPQLLKPPSHPRVALACLCWTWCLPSQYWLLALIILFLLCIKCSWILPFNPTWWEFVFILCCFLGTYCLCPAVVCYNDTWFLFLLQGKRGDEETMLATHYYPTILFSRPWSCVHLQERMVLTAGNLKPGYALQQGT